MKNPIIKSLILLALLSAMVFLFISKVQSSMIDFEVNYTAGQRLKWGEGLYRVEDEHYMFKYPPPAAILYVPLTYLPLNEAKAIWYFLVISSSAAIVLLSKHFFLSKRRPAGWTLFIPLLVLSRYFFREIKLGQINALITVIIFLMTAVLIRSEKRLSWIQEVISGVLWGFAVVLKTYALIFLPYLISRKKVVPIVSGLLFIGCAIAAPSLYYGWNGNKKVFQEWIVSLTQSTPKLLSTQDNISLFAFFAKWTGDANWSVYPTLVSVLGLALLVFFVIKKRSLVNDPAWLESSLLLICIPLVSPLGWDYTLLMAFPGLMIIIHHFSSFPKTGKVVLIINLLIISFSLYDILGRELYTSFMSLSIITINSLILVAYLVYLRFQKIF